MDGARDMAGIGIPFAAGVAAGAALFHSPPSFPPSVPGLLSVAIILPALYSLHRFDNGTGLKKIRLFFACLFLAAGVLCSMNSILTSGISSGSGPLSRLAGRCYDILQHRIASIPYPSSATAPLINALLTGDRSGLDRDIVDMFRASGASHILALSGLHLGIIYLIISKLTIPLGNSPMARKSRYCIILSASGFYAMMTGASPSIVRALLFIIIGETAGLLGRKKEPARILLAALTIQLFIKPDVIRTLGFQLSYLAMAGICFLYPSLERLYPGGRWDPFRKVWQAAMLSVSCQVFTAPLTWYVFHSFPKYFLLTNLVALPLTSAVMVLSVTTIALSFTGACPYFLVCIDDKATGLLVRCLEIISSM